ncbi:MOSC domain-containing protein [Reinekea sp.]|jgi:uncharacterized protein YcbX|uniref:MOSC domain-containing protein n=1 Tax=Reinekea sp. TaxID=1970455 RepID=UPI002A803C28|nr:MOSC N-terminal beta barrel domain-containing protein [Reinekea sp.]
MLPQNTAIKALFIYPVKSLAGVRVATLDFNSSGVVNDRRYMLVDGKNRMLTQRSHCQLAQFHLTQVVGGWRVSNRQGAGILIEDEANSERLIDTEVWSTPIRTREKSRQVSQWFSEQLDEWVRLVEFDDLESRYCAVDQHQVPFSFADGFPLLICNDSSLCQLSRAVDYPLDMARFRPNVVIDMPVDTEFQVSALNADDGGQLLFIEPCVRCNVPAIDPLTGVFQKDLHLQLKAQLKRAGKVVFGMNAAAIRCRQLSIGQELGIIEA